MSVNSHNGVSDAGKILQIVQGKVTTAIGAGSLVVRTPTGLTATITPTSPTSKIMILVSQSIRKEASNISMCWMQLCKNSGEVLMNQDRILQSGANLQSYGTWSPTWIDEPNATSPITYYTTIGNVDGWPGCYAQPDDTPSYITLIEFAG